MQGEAIDAKDKAGVSTKDRHKAGRRRAGLLEQALVNEARRGRGLYTGRVPVANRAAAGNLPAEPTSFVGRRRLLAEVKAAFVGTRLLTLVGPGGVGKTRLALRAAADLQRTVRDGVWFVELAGLDDPHLVAKAVMSAVGLVDQSGQWPTSVLVAHLAPREAVLVVDNCEHLLDAIAVLADVLLKEAPGVRVLATSRQPLGISGERVVQVPSLTLADGGDGEAAQGFAPSEAVALLVERAGNAGIQLEVNEANRQLVTDLCRRLDGMPLALELAAVRLRTIGLDQLVERLSDRFAVLTGGSRAALPRQQTLKATIDWSHDLLTAPEAAVLRRLAVFPSDFGLDAAEAVASGEDVPQASVLELLAGLVEKSFVARLGVAASARYRLHETMREYALLKLRAADEEAATLKVLVKFYSGICQAARALRRTHLRSSSGSSGSMWRPPTYERSWHIASTARTTRPGCTWWVRWAGTGRRVPQVRACTGWTCSLAIAKGTYERWRTPFSRGASWP